MVKILVKQQSQELLEEDKAQCMNIFKVWIWVLASMVMVITFKIYSILIRRYQPLKSLLTWIRKDLLILEALKQEHKWQRVS